MHSEDLSAERIALPVCSSPFSLFTKGLPQEKRKPFMEVRWRTCTHVFAATPRTRAICDLTVAIAKGAAQLTGVGVLAADEEAQDNKAGDRAEGGEKEGAVSPAARDRCLSFSCSTEV